MTKLSLNSCSNCLLLLPERGWVDVFMYFLWCRYDVYLHTNRHCSLIYKIRSFTARLLCDGTNLPTGGEVKGKKDSGVSKPVTSHSNAEISCQQQIEVSTPHICCKRIWTRPFRPYTKIVVCACAITLQSSSTWMSFWLRFGLSGQRLAYSRNDLASGSQW
jgi:hypothetical protein